MRNVIPHTTWRSPYWDALATPAAAMPSAAMPSGPQTPAYIQVIQQAAAAGIPASNITMAGVDAYLHNQTGAAG